MRRTLERIYRQHRQGLYSLALSITRRPELAEEAVQEAFVRLWRSKAEPSGEPVAYVHAAVRNTAIDVASEPSETIRIPVSIFESQVLDPQLHAIDAERRQLVRQAVETLPDAERQTLVLKIYAGLTFQQIAQVFGEPLSTVSSRYRRVLERLKVTMEQCV